MRKKTMKRVVASVLAALMTFGSVPYAWAQDEMVEENQMELKEKVAEGDFRITYTMKKTKETTNDLLFNVMDYVEPEESEETETASDEAEMPEIDPGEDEPFYNNIGVAVDWNGPLYFDSDQNGDWYEFYKKICDADITVTLARTGGKFKILYKVVTEDDIYSHSYSFYSDTSMSNKVVVSVHLDEGYENFQVSEVEDGVIRNDETGIPDKNLYAMLLKIGDELDGNGDNILTVLEAANIETFNMEYINESGYYENMYEYIENIDSYANLSKYCPDIYSTGSSFEVKDTAIESFYDEFLKLEWLRYASFNIRSQEHVDGLKKLASLESLSLNCYETNDTEIDVSGLCELKNLRYFGISSDNFIKKEEAINGMTKLREVSAGEIDLTKLTDDAKKRIENLQITLSSDSDFSKFENLEYMYITLNGYDMTGIKNTKLETIYVSNWNIKGETSKYSFLKEFPETVRRLIMYKVPVTSVKDDTNITSLDPEVLNELHIAHANLEDIEGLEKFTNLVLLSLYGNELSDISPLANMENLCDLNLSNNNIKDISPLKELSKLNYLYLEGNDIEDASSLSGMTGLYSLYLSRNNILKLPDMKNFDELESISLYGNKLSKEEILEKVPEKFTKDKEWMLEALQKATESGKLYYDSLTSDDIGMLMELNFQNEYESVFVEKNGKVEINEELVELLKKYDSTLEIEFIDTETDDYVSNVTIYGSMLKEDFDEAFEVSAVKEVEVPKELISKYTDKYGEVKVYGFSVPDESIEGVHKSFSLPDMNKSYWLYFYDTAKKESVKVSNTTVYYEIADHESFYDGEIKYRFKPFRTEEEGFYYFVEGKYSLPTSEKGEYSDPPYVDAETEYEGDIIKKIENAETGDTIKGVMAYPFLELGSDIWNKAIDKKLNFEFIMTARGIYTAEISWTYKDMEPISGNGMECLTISAYMYKENNSEEGKAEKDFVGDNVAMKIYTYCSHLKKVNTKLYVGEGLKNGDVVEFSRIAHKYKGEMYYDSEYEGSTAEEIAKLVVDSGIVEFALDFSQINKGGNGYFYEYVYMLVSDRKQDEVTVVEPSGEAGKNDNPYEIADDKLVESEKVSESIIDTIEGGTIRKNIEVVAKNTAKLSKEVFESVKENSKNISVGVVNDDNKLMYEWSFDYKTVDAEKFADIDLTVTFDTEKKEEIEKITGQKDAVYLNFAHHGDLPGPATMKTFVGEQYKNGDIVYLYYYNEESGKIESVGGSAGLTVTDGYVEYTITHCSIYFLSTEKPKAEEPENPINPTEPEEPAKPAEPEEPAKPGNNPFTGDESDASIMVIMLLAAMMAVASLNISKKCRRY